MFGRLFRTVGYSERRITNSGGRRAYCTVCLCTVMVLMTTCLCSVGKARKRCQAYANGPSVRPPVSECVWLRESCRTVF